MEYFRKSGLTNYDKNGFCEVRVLISNGASCIFMWKNSVVNDMSAYFGMYNLIEISAHCFEESQ